MSFTLEAESPGSRARAGKLETLHGTIPTPIFMPVGTHANVRGQRHETLENFEFPILLANTYHLMLRPGTEVFERMGGIHRFMDWKGSILTDSGGFQIFSLPNEREMSEEGALFRSYVDQQKILLTPEHSIAVQKAIGSDIMMVLDQCIPSTASRTDAENAMHLTHRWARRSFEARGNSKQKLFGIVQGACFQELRKISVNALGEIPFDGFAIGGLAVGETKAEREDITEFTVQFLPRHLPRYLMGVGTPADLLEAVHRGVDMFDCILPNALGQQGVAFTSNGKVDVRRGFYRFSEERLDATCPCNTCRRYSTSYLHHLIRAKQSLGGYLIAEHNLFFYASLMREVRQSILEGRFLELYRAKRDILVSNDRQFPVASRVPKRIPNLELGKYRLHESRSGAFSIAHIPSSEVMHAVNDPMEESRTLYIVQSRLQERLVEEGNDPLVIWDVGLGAAFNAMAALLAFENLAKTGTRLRPMQILSFEKDLDSLRLALKHQNKFVHLRHQAPVQIAQTHFWKSNAFSLEWKLFEGDFKEKIAEATIPDLIFFDPFSLHTDTDAWTLTCFKNIWQRCQHHATELFTYSSSTAVRALLLAAGFYVAKGVRMGSRPETTVALTKAALHLNSTHAVLLAPWLDLWGRSGAKFPSSLSLEEHQEFEQRIRSHAQFSNEFLTDKSADF